MQCRMLSHARRRIVCMVQSAPSGQLAQHAQVLLAIALSWLNGRRVAPLCITRCILNKLPCGHPLQVEVAPLQHCDVPR